MRQSVSKRASNSGKSELFSILLDGLRAHFVLRDSTVLLIGSVAREMLTKWSDIDLVVISARPRKTWIPPAGMHIQFETRQNFLRRLRKGEDLPAWALRFGKVLHDDGWWSGISKKTDLINIWPDWRLKLDHARRRLEMANALHEMGDISAAWEEYLYAASHITRAVLLASYHFPLSRGELAKQLSGIGEKELADCIRQLINEEPNKTMIEVERRILNRKFEALKRIAVKESVAV